MAGTSIFDPAYAHAAGSSRSFNLRATASPLGSGWHKNSLDGLRKRTCQSRRDSVTYLSRYLDFGSLEKKIVGKPHEARRFPMSDGTILGWV